MSHYYSTGLGSQQTAMQAEGFAVTGVSTAVSAAAAAGIISSAAIPFIGPAIAVAALVATLLIKNSGCGETCIQTSQWANQAAAALQQNLDAYFALPVPRAQSNQTLALQTFDQVWAQLVKSCGDPQWGNAGKRCISDRQAGACTWKQDKTGGYPGEPAMGECWNWFNGYRDPIANDPNVVADAVAPSVSGTVATLESDLGISSSSAVPLLLVAGLVALAVLS
jgi:hypothetical protein